MPPQHDADEHFDLTLTAMAQGGHALGRHDGQTIFVPYTIPGERVRARITAQRGRVAFAEGLTLLEASADRVFPQCKHFGPGRCGGCHWQHINGDAQLLLKQDVLADQLSRVGKFDDDLIEQVLAPIKTAGDSPWAYRWHGRFHVTQGGELAFPGTQEGALQVIDACSILHPDLLDLLKQVEFDVSSVKKADLYRDSNGALMILLHVNDDAELPELSAELPMSINALLGDNVPVNLIGDSALSYQVKDRVFRVTAGAAFQPNVSALPMLIDQVLHLLEPGPADSVLDLYAGVGLYGAFIAPHVSLLTLVDSYPPAVTDADFNLSDHDNVDIIEASVEEALETLEEPYTSAVLSPPSSGLSVDVVDALGELALRRLVYVSSDPATLSRDAARLVRHGYTLRQVQPIDLHPQTYFLDTVALLEHA